MKSRGAENKDKMHEKRKGDKNPNNKRENTIKMKQKREKGCIKRKKKN
jgi:hypothetical protein